MSNYTHYNATQRFVTELNELLTEYNRANDYKWKTWAEVVEGRKFFRVLRHDTLGSRSIWFLVDRDTGLIYKAKGYSGGPANRIVRGSVESPARDVWQRTISPHGMLDAR